MHKEILKALLPDSFLKEMDIEKPDEATIKAITTKVEAHLKELHRNDPEYVKSIKEKADGESLGKTNTRVKKQLKEMGFAEADLKDKDIDSLLGLAKSEIERLKGEQGSKDDTVKSLQQAQTDLVNARNDFEAKTAQYNKDKEAMENGFKGQLKQRDVDSKFANSLAGLKFNIGLDDAQLLLNSRFQKRGIGLDIDAKGNLTMTTQDGGKILAKNGKEHINPNDIKAMVIEEAGDLLQKANDINPDDWRRKITDDPADPKLTPEMQEWARKNGVKV